MTKLMHKFFKYIYYNPPHVSSNILLILRRSNCINTASGIVTLSKWPFGAQDEKELCLSSHSCHAHNVTVTLTALFEIHRTLSQFCSIPNPWCWILIFAYVYHGVRETQNKNSCISTVHFLTCDTLQPSGCEIFWCVEVNFVRQGARHVGSRGNSENHIGSTFGIKGLNFGKCYSFYTQVEGI